MAAVSQRTLSWLWDVLRREYQDVQRTYADLAQTLAQHPSLAPRTDVYTSEAGAPALLVHLTGTIPVNFRGSQYQFPIAIWVPQAYPREPPILYVTPTDDMTIRPGQHVSGSDGKIYHPYLARWREAWERSTIVDFLRLLVDVFAKEPPVMSRQQGQLQQQGPPQVAQPPPRPPPPGDQRPPSARPSSTTPGGPPPPPPKTNDRFVANPQPPISSKMPSPGRYDAPPPLPGQAPRPLQPNSTGPPAPIAYQPQFQPSRQDDTRQSYPNQRPPPVQVTPQSAQFHAQRQSFAGPPMPAVLQQQQMQSQNSYQHAPPMQAPQPTQIPLQQKQYQMPQPNQRFPGPQPQGYQQTPQAMPQPHKPKTPQPNLMDDSPFDISLPATNANLPTPAIPPNPEKQHILQTLASTLLTTLQNQITQSSAALAPLQSQYVALQQAEQTLQSELAQLKTLQGQLSQNINSLDGTIKSADRTISSSQSSGSSNKVPSIDELIIPPTVVARQLYDAVAEQRGFEATIYALTEGFVRGRIGSELWARKTREVARDDFRRKYLIKRRLGAGMGLDMSQMP